MNRYLLLGAGRSRERRLDPRYFTGASLEARTDFTDGELYTVDSHSGSGPDLVMDLNRPLWNVLNGEQCSARLWRMMQRRDGWSLPSGAFAEVHAYEVLEHLGEQGEVSTFFDTFREIWRLLEPDGFLCASVPSIHSPWLWADPGHRRVIAAEGLCFLERTHPLAPPSSDYREYLDFDFARVWEYDTGSNLFFILRAVNPPRDFAGS